MYTLFGYQGSGSAIVECALGMTGAPWRLVEAASWAGDSALGELERVNPLRQIPTLVLPDGQALTESAAILMHLAFAHPASGLIGSDPAERDRVLRGLVFIAANCYSCITVIDYPERFTTATDPASLDAIRAGTRSRLHRHWDIFADLHPVERGRFIGGERPGALDLMAATVSKWSGARPHLAASRPAFFALAERIDAHADVAPVFERHWPKRQQDEST